MALIGALALVPQTALVLVSFGFFSFLVLCALLGQLVALIALLLVQLNSASGTSTSAEN